MNGRLWILVALAATALLISSTPVFRDPHGSKSATQVFETILHDGYAGWTGFHTCIPEPTAQHDLCWAELHKGNRYRLVELDIDMSQSNPYPTEVAHHDPWTRGPFHVAAPEGHGTANTLEYGWRYLMRTVPAHKLPQTLMAVDGDATAFPRQMFLFRCTGTPDRITCRNSLGDSLAFTPNHLTT